MRAMADELTRVVVSPDGTLIARVVAEHIELVNGGSLAVEGEIGIDASAAGHDVLMAGDPLRLIVLSRYGASVRMHVIDPRGPTAMGELPIKAELRMLAAAGNHVWLTGPTGSLIADVTRKDPAVWPVPLRTPVTAAGSFTGGRFVISTAGAIEEWSPDTRAAVRRFRLGKAVPASFVGGGARQVWMVPASEPDRIELIPLINHGQPPRLELPEPIARIAADPLHENLIAIGANTNTAFAIDLSGRIPVTALEGLTAHDAAWLAGTGAVVVAAVGLGLEVVPVVGRSRPGLSERTDTPRTPAPSAPAMRPAPAAEAVPTNVAERLSAWRERMRASAPREAPSATAWIGPTEQPATWRDFLCTWTRSVLSGTHGEPPVITDGPLVDVANRLGLDGELARALWFLYGARLCGHDGVAPVDLAAILKRRWDEAVGRGVLVSTGVARWRGGQARLTRVVADALDEQPPRHGALIVSAAPAADRTRAVVAPADVDLDALARWAAPQVGPLFVPTARGVRRPDRFVLEARLRGALPVLTWPRPDTALPPAALLVVADEATARAVPAPVLATWPG